MQKLERPYTVSYNYQESKGKISEQGFTHIMIPINMWLNLCAENVPVSYQYYTPVLPVRVQT